MYFFGKKKKVAYVKGGREKKQKEEANL